MAQRKTRIKRTSKVEEEEGSEKSGAVGYQSSKQTTKKKKNIKKRGVSSRSSSSQEESGSTEKAKPPKRRGKRLESVERESSSSEKAKLSPERREKVVESEEGESLNGEKAKPSPKRRGKGVESRERESPSSKKKAPGESQKSPKRRGKLAESSEELSTPKEDKAQPENEEIVNEILTFAHHISAGKDGIQKGAKFQPKYEVKKTKLPSRSKKLTKAQKERWGIVEGNVFESNLAKRDIPAQDVREEVENMGVDKFKKLSRSELEAFYRRMEGTEENPPLMKPSQIADYILRRLGISKV